MELYKIWSSSSYNKITDKLYLSNYICASDEEFIKNNNINVVINCSKDLEKPLFYSKYNITFLRIPINDSTNESETKIFNKYLDDGINLIYNSIRKNLNVLVHCYAGIQRSATLVLCYIMKELRIFIDLKYPNYFNIDKNINNINNININKKIKKEISLNELFKYLKEKRYYVFLIRPTFINLILEYYNKTLNNS